MPQLHAAGEAANRAAEQRTVHIAVSGLAYPVSARSHRTSQGAAGAVSTHHLYCWRNSGTDRRQNLAPSSTGYRAESQHVSQIYEASCMDVIRSLCVLTIVLAGAYPAIQAGLTISPQLTLLRHRASLQTCPFRPWQLLPRP